MNQIEIIILHCLKKINNERTVYSVFHLLKGKKSSQTIQDAHLFSLKKFFGIVEPLSRETFEKIIASLMERKLIYDCGDNRSIPAPSGELILEKGRIPIFMNGWDYHQITSLFWERLSLMVQVASNLEYGGTNYIPIQKNQTVHLWLKTVLINIPISKKEIGPQLYNEIMECFKEADGIEPSTVVFRLTGHQQIGLTSEQAAKKLNLDFFDYQLEFINTVHFMIQKLRSDSKAFLLLGYLLAGMKENDELTQSAKKTWNLLVQGFSAEKIAAWRNLKISTIEDHLVEFALHKAHFLIDDYIDKGLQTEILDISRQEGTRQLKVIKDKVKTASYFQIRLVLAKYGERRWN